MGGGGRKERRGVRSLGLALAPAWRAPPSGTGRPRIPVTAPPFPPPGSGVAGALLLSPSPDASLSHPISLNAVYTFVNGPFVYTAVNHLFAICFLLGLWVT